VATADDAKSILSDRPKLLAGNEAVIEAGKRSFARFGWVGCRGLQLQGGVPNPNSQGGEVPSLLHASEDYNQTEVASIIRNGKIPPLADSAKPAPPLSCPPGRTP